MDRLGQENVAEKAMAPHSSNLAWKIPWTEEPDRLQSMESRRVGHDWATSLSLFTLMSWRRKWQPTPVFLPGESQGWGSLVAATYGVAQSRTWLKWLSNTIFLDSTYMRYYTIFVFLFLAYFNIFKEQEQVNQNELHNYWELLIRTVC